MDDSEMLEALELLVDREGQRGAARLLGVNRGTVADWIKRDTMTPRMRDAIERGLREYAEHLDLPPQLRPDVDLEEARNGDQMAEVRSDVDALTSRVDEIERWRTSLIPAVTSPLVPVSPLRRWLRGLRVPFSGNKDGHKSASNRQEEPEGRH